MVPLSFSSPIVYLAPTNLLTITTTMNEPLPLCYIAHHVFLPPELPQKDDQPDHYANDHDLAILASRCALKFCEDAACTDEELSLRWGPILGMLQNFADLNDAEPFTTDDLYDRLTALRTGGTISITLLCIPCL